MLRTLVIVAAIGVWAVSVFCALVPSRKPAPSTAQADGATEDKAESLPPPAIITNREGLPFCAVGMQIQRLDWIDKYKQSIDEIAAMGADTVKFVVDTRQETIKSTHIFLDVRMTPGADQLIDLVKYAKSRKLRVILMPIVLLDNPRGDDWRGKYDPQDEYGGWPEWFESYRQMLYHFSWIAEASGVDVFVVGSELISTERFTNEWIKNIVAVRKVYHGRLTYSSNWDHYRSIKFWDYLDLIGMNSYWKFGEEGTDEDPSLDHIKDRWKEIQSDLFDFIHEKGKPLLFLEIGWFSQKNVAYEPWDYTQDQPVALELQRKLYQGFFESWWGNQDLAGFSVWEWTPGEGGPNDKGYTPKNKPAEAVLKEWLVKPRWTVR